MKLIDFFKIVVITRVVFLSHNHSLFTKSLDQSEKATICSIAVSMKNMKPLHGYYFHQSFLAPLSPLVQAVQKALC